MSTKIQVLKIGGSLLTDKFSGEPVFARDNARRLAAEIAELTAVPIVVHGTGSYGKPPAKKYGYLNGFVSSSQANVVSTVSGILETLHQNVIDTFRQAGLPAIGLSAGSLITTRNGAIVECAWRHVVSFVERGIMPVISGNFVIDDEQDFAVCSSDWIASHLAISAGADRLVFATDVPGVSTCVGSDTGTGGRPPANAGEPPALLCSGGRPPAGSQILLSSDYETLRQSLSDSPDDVSHGMDGKLQAGFLASEHGVEVYIVDGTVAGNLTKALADETPQATRLLSHHAKPAHTARR